MWAERQVTTIFNLFNLKISRANTNAKPSVFFEIDTEFLTLYNAAQNKTDMSSSDNLLRRQRHHTLIQLLKQTLPMINTGHVAECGCWRGLSSYQIAHHLQKADFKNTFYIFDSFEGLSKFQEEDSAGFALPNEGERCKYFACPLETVKDNLKEYAFIDFKKGWIPDRFDEVRDSNFSFVHIDVDLYQPIRDSLQFFYPRMVKGGIIVFDDYGCLDFPGAKKAVDEFLERKRDFFLHLPSGEAFLIKG